MRLMQVHKSSSGDKPILPQPFDFSRYAGRQSKLLMRTDVKRREIWKWRDHTRWPTVTHEPGLSTAYENRGAIFKRIAHEFGTHHNP